MAKALDTPAAKSLARYLEKGAIGRLYLTTSAGAAGTGAVEVSVFIQDGALLAAEGTDDSHHYVRRLRVADVFNGATTMDLLAKVVKRQSIFGRLIDGSVPGPILDTVLLDRFRDNLARYLGSEEKVRFEQLNGIFVDNLQMGLDPVTTIAECATLWDLASTIPLDRDLMPAASKPSGPLETQIVDALKQPKVATGVLARMPVDPIAGRALIAQMVKRSVLKLVVRVSETIPPAHPLSAPVRPPPPAQVEEAPAEEVVDDAPTVVTPQQVLTFDEDAPEPAPAVTRSATPPLPPEPAEAPAVAPTDDVPHDEDAHDADDEEAIERSIDGDEVVDDVPSVQVDGDVLPEDEESDEATAESRKPQTGEGAFLASLSAWSQKATEVDEDLEAFADHDENRGVATGASKSGTFSTETHNLDRVEVAEELTGRQAELPPAVDDEPIEAEAIPQVKFGAALLTEEEAVEKVDVANEVLGHILGFFDAHQGAGAGVAAVQLLLDGSPARFATLFDGAQASDEAVLDAALIIGNLATRPPTEHRRMLSDGLSDLIERALSMGADELADEQIDQMLESTAGYRQRLGV